MKPANAKTRRSRRPPKPVKIADPPKGSAQRQGLRPLPRSNGQRRSVHEFYDPTTGSILRRHWHGDGSSHWTSQPVAAAPVAPQKVKPSKPSQECDL